MSRHRKEGVTLTERDLRKLPELVALLKAEPEEPCHAAIGACPFIGCRWQLWSDFTRSGSLAINFPKIPANRQDLMGETCALRAAANGEQNFLEVSLHLGTERAATERAAKIAFVRFARRWQQRPAAK